MIEEKGVLRDLLLHEPFAEKLHQKEKKGRRFRARCQFCEFISKLNLGPVFAGWDGLAHAKLVHPDREGCVAIIEEVLT